MVLVSGTSEAALASVQATASVEAMAPAQVAADVGTPGKRCSSSHVERAKILPIDAVRGTALDAQQVTFSLVRKLGRACNVVQCLAATPIHDASGAT